MTIKRKKLKLTDNQYRTHHDYNAGWDDAQMALRFFSSRFCERLADLFPRQTDATTQEGIYAHGFNNAIENENF